MARLEGLTPEQVRSMSAEDFGEALRAAQQSGSTAPADAAHVEVAELPEGSARVIFNPPDSPTM